MLKNSPNCETIFQIHLIVKQSNEFFKSFKSQSSCVLHGFLQRLYIYFEIAQISRAQILDRKIWDTIFY